MRARNHRKVHLLYEVPAVFITHCAMARVDLFSLELQIETLRLRVQCTGAERFEPG